MKRAWNVASVSALGLLALGCGGDMVKQLMTKPEFQQRVMQVIGSNGVLAGRMTDQLLGSDSTRRLVVARLLANPDAAKATMLAMSHDRTMVEGIINLAVQDTAMRTSVLQLFKGMQMAGMGK